MESLWQEAVTTLLTQSIADALVSAFWKPLKGFLGFSRPSIVVRRAKSGRFQFRYPPDFKEAAKRGVAVYIGPPLHFPTAAEYNMAYLGQDLSNLRLRTPGVSPGVKASEGWEGFAGLCC